MKGERIQVFGDETAKPTRPIINVPVVQLAEVRRLLDQSGYHYFVRDEYISFNGGPEIAYIHIDRRVDVPKLRAMLANFPTVYSSVAPETGGKVVSGEHLKVYGGAAGAFIELPLTQLSEIRGLLESLAIPHSVAEHAISFDDEPETISIEFPRGVDVDAIQMILDSVDCN